MTVAIVGGGASAHLLAVLLSGQGHMVRVLTSRPNDWARELELEVGDEVLRGRIQGASTDYTSTISDADIAFLCMPVHQYPNALNNIADGLRYNSKCIVGAIYGQGGFDWMVQDVCKRHGIPGVRHFAIGLLPWIARTKIYGKRSISYGPKLRNGIATSDIATFEYLQHNILNDLSQSYWGCGKFERVPNFMTVTLTVDNQIIHPARCYALASSGISWKNSDMIPYFYRDWDDYSAGILKGVDDDYTKVRKALFCQFPRLSSKYDLDYLSLEHWSYGSHNPDIKASFVNSTTLAQIKPPTIVSDEHEYVLDVNHRFFKDDFAFGLEICRWFADELKVDVPNVSRLIEWYRKNVQPLQTTLVNSGAPSSYGFSLHDITCMA